MHRIAAQRLARSVDEPFEACRETIERKLLTDPTPSIPIGRSISTRAPLLVPAGGSAGFHAVTGRHQRGDTLQRVIARTWDRAASDGSGA
jgi:hypothetical protein